VFGNDYFDYIYGIVTTGTEWHFIIYTPDGIYSTSGSEYQINLTKSAVKDNPELLRSNVKRVIGIIVGLLKDPQIQTIIDHFTEKPNMEFTDEAEDEEQDDEVVTKVTPDQNNVLEVLPLAKLTSTTSIPLAHDSAKRLNGNSSDNSSKIDPVNSPKAEVSTSSTTSSSQIYESNQS
jgi:hypothetical protein